MEGAIPISEIIHHSVRRTSSGAFTSQREPSSKRARCHIFFHVFFAFSFISRIKWSQSSLRFSMSHRDAIRTMLLRHSKSQRANTLPGLLDSALRSKRLRIMDQMDGRFALRTHLFSPFAPYSRVTLRSSPAGPKTSPFQSHSTLLRFSSRLRSR